MTSLAVSVVSHGQGQLVKLLLNDLCQFGFEGFDKVDIFVTINMPDDVEFLEGYLDHVTVLRNPRSMGFGANHNQAFAVADSDFFIVLNPDVRLLAPIKLSYLNSLDREWGCLAPLVLSPSGRVEDSARRYPTISRIIRRVILNQRGSDYSIGSDARYVAVEWIAGMFLVFPSSVYRELRGFDTSYFMYLEDADICRRINKAGYQVLLSSEFSVVHDARRNSFKNFQHFRWHLRSMIRFIMGF